MNKEKLYRRLYAPAEPLTDSFAQIHSEEAEAKTRAEALHPCTTYRADVELLRKGIIKKVGDEDGREADVLEDDC